MVPVVKRFQSKPTLYKVLWRRRAQKNRNHRVKPYAGVPLSDCQNAFRSDLFDTQRQCVCFRAATGLAVKLCRDLDDNALPPQFSGDQF